MVTVLTLSDSTMSQHEAVATSLVAIVVSLYLLYLLSCVTDRSPSTQNLKKKNSRRASPQRSGIIGQETSR